MEHSRPDPESILKFIKRAELRSKGGKLKIFFGMCAGVGKTYEMLEAAQQKRRDNADVVVGVVETHGRTETAKLLEGLPAIPLMEIEYKGAKFKELNIDEILKRKPQIVLIDELAHTNIPGTRHPKRWQDVMEILDAGIDVYTTMNIQHVESRKDIVEAITGITIRETVPDLLLERATEIRLIDLSPAELLKRLSEGKVYLGGQSQIAIQNFFKEEHLTALREIVLRFIAEKVDHELHTMMAAGDQTTTWKTIERLLVAVSSSPHSENLIRTTRRLAFNLDAPWVAVYVDTGKELNEEDQARLTKNIALARELGAEFVSTTDIDVVNGIQKIAKQNNVTQIIVGRSEKASLWQFLTGGSILERLSNKMSDVDVHVVRQIPMALDQKKPSVWVRLSTAPFTYFKTLLVILALTVLNWYLDPLIGYKAIGFTYLLFILALSLLTGRGPILLAALLSLLLWDYLFIPSTGTLVIHDAEDIVLAIFFFVVALATGTLVGRIRTRELLIGKREDTVQVLYEILREFGKQGSTKKTYIAISEKLGSLLDGECAIIPKSMDNELNFNLADKKFTEKEKGVATWVFANGKEAGWGTDTLSSVSSYFIPLIGFDEIVGVMTYKPHTQRLLKIDDTNLLHSVGQLVAQNMQHEFEEERKRREHTQEQAEKIHRSFMGLLVRQINPPLKALRQATMELQQKIAEESQEEKKLITDIEESSGDLNSFVENMLAKSRMIAEFLAPLKEFHHVSELIDACVEDMSEQLQDYKLVCEIPEAIPPASFDVPLMEIAICNLLENMLKITPIGREVYLKADKEADYILVSIEGSEASEAEEDFETKYPRTPEEDEEISINITIVKNIIELHHGKFEKRKSSHGATQYHVYIPLKRKKQATKINL